MMEVTFNFLNLIYDGMKEENLNFKNLKVQIFLIKYIKSYSKRNVKSTYFCAYLKQIDSHF